LLNQSVGLQRFATRNLRLPAIANRRQEVFDQRAVRIVGKVHHIGATTGAAI
jgi:hypothetical protein